jgi:hypothetical protein
MAFMSTFFAQTFSRANLSLPLAVWHSQTNDRNQREMLRAALGPWAEEHPKDRTIKSMIKFLLHETNELSGKRNDALHCPLNILRNTRTFVFTVAPEYFWGHPMGERLKEKDVLYEFHLYRVQTECLRDFALKVRRHMANSSAWPLPQKPTLPTAVPYSNHKARRRGSRPKSPPPPLQSSGG